MDQVPLIFGVRQDKQPVDIPTQMVQDQDLSQAQMERIRVAEVAAVPVQEKLQVRRRTQSLPRQLEQGTGQQPSRVVQPLSKRPYGPTPPSEKEHADAVRRRVQDMADRQSLTPSLADPTYDPDSQTESWRTPQTRRFQEDYDQMRAQRETREQLDQQSQVNRNMSMPPFDSWTVTGVQAGRQLFVSTPAPAMGGVGHGGRTVMPPQALQREANIQPTPVPSDHIFQQVFLGQAAQA